MLAGRPMSDGSKTLTDEQHQLLTNWFRRTYKEQQIACRVCKKTTWNWIPHVVGFVIRRKAGKGMLGVIVGCANCGYTHFHMLALSEELQPLRTKSGEEKA